VTRPLVALDAGALSREGWRDHGLASARVPLAATSATVHGHRPSPGEWARLRWGAEAIDGDRGDGCGLYLHVDHGEGSARVRSALEVGRHVTADDGERRAVAVVSRVSLARDARGAGGWAWVLGLVSVGAWRRRATYQGGLQDGAQ
jgi:hypothetical protein